MLDLLRNLYDKIESIKGKKLVLFLSLLFVIFIGIGSILGYIIQSNLKEPEFQEPPKGLVEPPKVETHTFTGKIDYVNPEIYSYSYVLVGSDGKDVILLDAKDEKLQIAEGLYVTVTGKKKPNVKSMDLEVLIVEEVIISNVTD